MRIISWKAVRALGVSVLIGAAAIWALFSVLDAIKVRFAPVDFYVYRYAVAAVVSGKDVYAGNVFGPLLEGGLPFTYTPFALIVLAPTTLADEQLAYFAWSMTSLLCFALALVTVVPGILRRWWQLPLTILMFLPSSVIAQHLVFGQINLLLMMLCLVDMRLTASPSKWSRFLPPGVLIGVATATKLTPGLFIVFLALQRRWKEFFTSVGSVLTCFGVGFLVFPSASQKFFTDVLWHLSSRVELDGFFATSGNNSVQGLFAALGHPFDSFAIVVTALVGVAGLWIAHRITNTGSLLHAGLVVGLTAPLVSPISWIHHWVYILPAVVVVFIKGGRKDKCFALTIGAGLLAQATDLGDWILQLGQPLLFIPGAILREWLLLSAVTLILRLSHVDSNTFRAILRKKSVPSVLARPGEHSKA